jgi:hypothetical protein
MQTVSGTLTVTVPAAEAVVVRLDAAGQFSGPIQMNENGALEMYAIAGNGAVQHDWQKAADIPQSPSADWNGWSTSGINTIASTGGVAAAKNQDNTVQIFVPTSTGVYSSLHEPTAWDPWTKIVDGTKLTNLAAGSGADGSLTVFGLDSNGKVNVASEAAPEIGWPSAWTQLNSGTGPATVEPGYVVGRNLDGHLELFGVDGSGTVWHIWQADNGDWSDWQELAGEILQPNLAVARNLNGDMQLFGVDSSGNVWTIAQTSPGQDWSSSWIQITGKTMQPGFVVGQNKDGRLVLFGVSTQSPYDVFNIWQQGSAGGSFGGNWTDMGGGGLNPQLVVSTTKDQRIQLFAVGSGGVIQSNWQPTSGGGWNGWANFGGSGLAFYPGQP